MARLLSPEAHDPATALLSSPVSPHTWHPRLTPAVHCTPLSTPQPNGIQCNSIFPVSGQKSKICNILEIFSLIFHIQSINKPGLALSSWNCQMTSSLPQIIPPTPKPPSSLAYIIAVPLYWSSVFVPVYFIVSRASRMIWLKYSHIFVFSKPSMTSLLKSCLSLWSIKVHRTLSISPNSHSFLLSDPLF